MSKNETQAKEGVDAVKGDPVKLLQGLNGGQTLYTFQEKIEETVKKVMELSKDGEVNLKLKFSKKRDFGEHAVMIVVDVTSKLPKADPEAVIRFALDDGKLVEDDPRQMKFDFKEKAARQAAAPAAE